FHFADAATANVHKWTRWIIEQNLPFCEIENKLTRQMVRLDPVTISTVKRAMELAAKRIGAAIEEEMGEGFGFVFDGWSKGDDGQSAVAHVEHFEAILKVYGKTKTMVKVLVGDGVVSISAAQMLNSSIAAASSGL
ncbi:TPA: hypothetical protein N0F65_010861, partial [Lagenidium giganteum]